ncbi:MAG: hypothetical protein WA399_03115 [Acidobacteriaceae bacterium]
MLKKLAEAERVLAIYASATHGIQCGVVGKLKLFLEGNLSIQPEGNLSITEASALNTSIDSLLRFPCVFADSREFAKGPFASFFQEEVPFAFGLAFAFPNGLLSIMELEGTKSSGSNGET